MSSSDPIAHLHMSAPPWESDRQLGRVMAAIAGKDETVRIVGGAVRDALLHRPLTDIDLATTARPETVMARALAAGFHPVPTGIAHGTVTIIASRKPYECTTLRTDVDNDGRRATVAFGRDWAEDAARRDFTVNALYADIDGHVIDYVGGIRDCAERRLRFIGDPLARIREDYLRILRFFRFNAVIAHGPLDAAGLEAAVHLRDGLATLSGERVGQEMLKLLPADHAPDVVRIMHATGILAIVLGDTELAPDRFARLHAILNALRPEGAQASRDDAAILLLAALASHGGPQCEAFAKRLRLSNAMRDRMMAAWDWVGSITPEITEPDARRLIYRNKGTSAYRDALLLSAASMAGPGDPDRILPTIQHLLDVGKTFVSPDFPVSGRDLLALGIPPGRALGNALDHLKGRWLTSDFALTKSQLLGILSATPDVPAPDRPRDPAND